MRGAQAAWKPLIDLMEESSPNGKSRRRKEFNHLPESYYSTLRKHIELLMDAESTENLPFTHFHTRLPGDPSPSTLLEIYTSLYQKARTAESKFSGGHVRPPNHNQKVATISYNLAMTTTTMAICPRRSEGAPLLNNMSLTKPESGEVALNGTMLAGTLMVKNEGDWNLLHQHPGLLDGLLRSIGVPTHPTTPKV